MLYAPCESRSPAARSIVIQDLECIIYARPLLMQYLARLMQCWLLGRWQRSAGDTILPGSRPDVPILCGISQPVSPLCPYFKIAPPTRGPSLSSMSVPWSLVCVLSIEAGPEALCGAEVEK